jgi:HSP20 family molecular chaperone IbpA
MNKIALYHPMDSVRTLLGIDCLADSFFGNQGLDRTGGAFRYPAIDIRETGDAYVLEAELPGYSEEDVEVNLDGGRLTIESKKENAAEKQDETFLIRERCARNFTRSFKLPENADLTSIEAAFNDGLLSLEIKKRTEALKRVIDIKKKVA